MPKNITLEVSSLSVKKLYEDELLQGNYGLPSFQRRFVWDEDNIKALIRSIAQSHPIGTIILWEPSSEMEEDKFAQPLIDVDRKVKPKCYVIDGQQRLTAICLLLNKWRITRNGKEIKRDPIAFDPASNTPNKRFIISKSKTRGHDISESINSVNAFDPHFKETAGSYFEDIRDLVHTILDYSIPIYTMKTHNENPSTFKGMTDAFIEVNKQGVEISNLELMLSFLVGGSGNDFSNRVYEIFDPLDEQFGIELSPIIRFILSNFKLKQTQITNIEQFKQNIDRISDAPKNIDLVFNKCKPSLNVTMNIVRTHLGVNSNIFPTQIPIIPIATYLYNKEFRSIDQIPTQDLTNIINWFVLVSFKGYYSTSPNSRLQADIELVRKEEGFPFDSLLSNVTIKKGPPKITKDDLLAGLEKNAYNRSEGRAYLFLEYALLSKSGATNWASNTIKTVTFGDLAKHHIFPQDFLDENFKDVEDEVKKEKLINNVGNLTFIHKETNSGIGDRPPEEYLTEYSEVDRKEHFIPEEPILWKFENYEDFLKKRVEMIYLAGKRIFPLIFE